MKAYLISFGDSDKYRVSFDGDMAEFESSRMFSHIKDEIYGYVRREFPGAGFKHTLYPDVEEVSAGEDGYPVLDGEGLEKLKGDVRRQMEVRMGYSELDLNAPFDEH